MQLKNTPSFAPATPALIPHKNTTQAQATTTKVENKARAILHSKLTPTQKLIVEAQSVLGGIKHTMATKPFTAKVIQQIDSIRSRLAKSVLGLPITAPTAAIFTTKTQYGVGQPLTAAAQTFECARAQIDAHNDTGRLGTATRAMMSALQQQGQITTAQAVGSTRGGRGDPAGGPVLRRRQAGGRPS